MFLQSCARMGAPDGGWYDEKPPHVVASSPDDKATGFSGRKVRIYFNEFIKVENVSEKVIVSPPQLDMPDIKASGKRIDITLKDSLIPNTTYTIDFSDAISDNNEGNPMGNYTFSFSTGEQIDTLEVSGYVLEAADLEPIKGILVGLYAVDDSLSQPTDSLETFALAPDSMSAKIPSPFTEKPFLRVARTNGAGRFIIKGVAPGRYNAYALEDMDGNYMLSQKSEKLAFSHNVIIPTWKPDIRQDTTWLDSLHIKGIERIHYTHFLPDDIVLRAFTVPQTDRYLLKTDRSSADHITFYFTYGSDSLPKIKGLNFNEENAFILEESEKKDTLTYWLRDTALVNQDTLRMEVCYEQTDTLGNLIWQTDTLDMLAKQSYAKRLKQQQKEAEEWHKKQDKLKKRGEPYDSIMPPKPLDMKFSSPSKLDPDKNPSFQMPAPLAVVDTSRIHLYVKHDSLWYRAHYQLRETQHRKYELRAEWKPGFEYSMELDSAAFIDIYGNASVTMKRGFAVNTLDEYATLLMMLPEKKGQKMMVQLLNQSGEMVKEVATDNGQAEFFFLTPGTYYMRCYEDGNANGKWDTGDYYEQLQAEKVYYYPDEIECRAKWDVTLTWNLQAKPAYLQKPSKIIKQKPDKERAIKSRNLDRARQMGIEYVPKP